MYWRVPMVILCLAASQALGEHSEYVFVIRELTECISNPVNDICPVDHKVPDIIENQPWLNRTTLSTTLNVTSTSLLNAGGNASCTEANEMFQCSKILYTCKDDEDYVYLNSSKTNQLCIAAEKECMGIAQGIQDSLFNCSLYTASTTRHSKGGNCKEYEKLENDTCPMLNYKVPSYVNFTDVVNYHQEVRRTLEQYKVGVNCTDDVLEAICDIRYPACTTNEKYIVSVLGKQMCNEITKCLNSTNSTLGDEGRKLCKNLPDEDTAEKLSIHEIENISPTTGVTSMTPNVTSTTPTPTKKPSTTCGASTLSAASHILMVFITLVFMGGLK